MIFGIRFLRKPNEIKGSGVRRVHKGDTISSQPRYDHFDTSPCLSQHLTPENHPGFWGELMGRTHMIFSFRFLRKPSKIKASGVWRVHKGHMISSQIFFVEVERSWSMRKMAEVAEARKIRRFRHPRTPKRRKPLIYQSSFYLT